jgi:hypothetical protein
MALIKKSADILISELGWRVAKARAVIGRLALVVEK